MNSFSWFWLLLLWNKGKLVCIRTFYKGFLLHLLQ